MKHFMIKEDGLELSQSPQWGIWIEARSPFAAPPASASKPAPPSEEEEPALPEIPRSKPRMPFGVRMDQLEDDGFKDKDKLIKMIFRYVQEATRKFQALIPEMEAFSQDIQHGFNFDLVDDMSYTHRNISELIKEMNEWWGKQLPKMKDACELSRYVPRITSWVAGGGLKDRAERWTFYQSRSNEQGRRLYQRAIDIITRLDRNIEQITDRLQQYCAK